MPPQLTAEDKFVRYILLQFFRDGNCFLPPVSLLLLLYPLLTRAATKKEDVYKRQALDSGEYGAILRAKGIVAAADGGQWLHYDFVPEEHQVRRGLMSATRRLRWKPSHTAWWTWIARGSFVRPPSSWNRPMVKIGGR